MKNVIDTGTICATCKEREAVINIAGRAICMPCLDSAHNRAVKAIHAHETRLQYGRAEEREPLRDWQNMFYELENVYYIHRNTYGLDEFYILGYKNNAFPKVDLSLYLDPPLSVLSAKELSITVPEYIKNTFIDIHKEKEPIKWQIAKPTAQYNLKIIWDYFKTMEVLKIPEFVNVEFERFIKRKGKELENSELICYYIDFKQMFK